MSALTTLFNIVNTQHLVDYDFKYCLVDSTKHPLKIDTSFVRPNHNEDFISLDELTVADVDVLDKYAGLGISINASNVCAIDIDHCIDIKNDIHSINKLGADIIDMFKDFAYIEFSFSGTGLRLFFKTKKIDNYETFYYIKNAKNHIEYYYPEGSARFVTITGNTIVDNAIRDTTEYEQSIFQQFLITYMQRSVIVKSTATNNEDFVDTRDLACLMNKVKFIYLTNNSFQDLWFSKAPGSGHDESERDYHLVAFLYENITKDKDKLKQIFEQSPFYKSKDYKHITKWTKQDYRYYNYLYSRIKGVKQ